MNTARTAEALDQHQPAEHHSELQATTAGLLADHDIFFHAFLDEVAHHPMNHINPYKTLEALRQQHELLHLLDSRLRAIES